MHLKSTLFIGLGGTGAQSIIQLKRKYIENYGEVPPMMAFLVFDTDQNIQQHEVIAKNGETIGLDNDEFVQISVQNPRLTYTQNRNTTFSWFPEGLRGQLAGPVKDGAGQIRAIGRFASMSNAPKINSAIVNLIQQITDNSIAQNSKYEWKLPAAAGIDVNFVFSLAGGTGSGCFMDIAYIAQEAFVGNNVHFNAYAVLPDVFRQMSNGPKMLNVQPNAYGAIEELDYFMHMDRKQNGKLKGAPSDKHKLNLPNLGTLDLARSPFDVVFLIGNRNTEGATFSHIRELSELIATTLFVSAGELHGNQASVLDNLKQVLISGGFDVAGKKAWASGVGFGEIVFDAELYAERFQRLTELQILKHLRAGGDELGLSVVDDWIDAVKIRENQNKDDVINACAPTQPAPFVLGDRNGAAAEAKQFLSDQSDAMQVSSQSKRVNYFEKKRSDFNDKINRIFKEVGALSNALAFMNLLIENIEQNFITEMRAELVIFNDRYLSDYQYIDQEAATLTWYNMANKRADFEGVVNSLVETVKDKIRREEAIQFYNDFIEVVKDKRHDLQSIIEKVEEVERECQSKANKILNGGMDRHRPFSILLHNDLITQLRTKKEEVGLETWLDKPNAFEWYLNRDANSISQELDAHSAQRTRTREILDMTVESVLLEMKPEEREETFRLVVSKSAPLWSHDYQGHLTTPIDKSFVFGTERHNDTLLSEMRSVLQQGEPLTPVFTNDKYRILLNRHETAVPAFIMQGMREYEQKVQRSGLLHYVDEHWKKSRDEMRFRVFPDRGIQEEEYLEMWVVGLLFGFIKIRNNEYQMFIDESTYAGSLYWVPMGKKRMEAIQSIKDESGEVDFAGKLTQIQIHQLEVNHTNPNTPIVVSSPFEERLRFFNELSVHQYLEEYALLSQPFEALNKDPRYKDELEQVQKELTVFDTLQRQARQALHG